MLKKQRMSTVVDISDLRVKNKLISSIVCIEFVHEA